MKSVLKAWINVYARFIYLVQFPVRNVSIIVDVIDPEGKPQLLLFLGLAAELGHPLNKLLEVYLPTAVIVKNI